MEVPVAVAGWANHADTFMSLIDSYKTKELFCDCTLACDRKLFRAHKLILAMSSDLFEGIFLATQDKNPVIILHEIEAWQVECLLNYMYKGETRVSDAHFVSLCRVAKSLQIKGFDKLELYREAVKQSRKKDSRLIARTEESANDNFFSIPPERRSPCAGDACHLYEQEHQGRGGASNIGGGAHLAQESHRRRIVTPPFASPRRPVATPVSASESPSPHHEHNDVPAKVYPPKGESKSAESASVSFSVRCNYQSSPTFNFKKNYLLSTSQSPPSKGKSEGPAPPGPSPSHHKTPPTQRHESPRQDCSAPPLPTPPSPHETCFSEEREAARHRSLRGPPPLLRIRYDDCLLEEGSIKVEDLPAQPSFEPPDDPLSPTPYPPMPPRPPEQQQQQQQPPLDNLLQLSLSSDPGSDPLLQKIPTNKRKRVRGPKSWEFLLRLLRSPESNPSLIKWENEDTGVFRLIRPDVIAFRWGRRTGKHVYDVLSYESFSRGLRYHYATGALCAVSEKSFVYQFGPKAQLSVQSSRKAKYDLPAGNS